MKYSNETIQQAVQLRAEGLTLSQIASKLNVSSSAVWCWCNPERSKELRDRNREHAWELEKIRREKNKEHYLQKRREWRNIPVNREAELLNARDWRRRNSDRMIEWKRKYYRDNPEANLFTGAKRRAARNNIEFTIKIDDIFIPEYCPYLGIPLYPGNGKQGPNSPTLDRIDPAVGYTANNIIVVSYKANTMKYDCDLQTIIDFGRRIEDLIKTDSRFAVTAKAQKLSHQPSLHLSKRNDRPEGQADGAGA